ncbi:MAG: restriction endonuclease subunit S [Polaromonas sp.]|nr:restriction endonuclease subunit S [Polaromonas sp.]
MTAITYEKLGDIAQYLRGINFKPDDVTDVGSPGIVACMRTKNIQEFLDCSDVWGVAESFVRRPEQILQEGDILVSSANSWNLVGKCCWIPNLPWKTTFGGFVSALRAKPKQVSPRFLYWWFSSDRTQALLRSFGRKTTSISNLSAEQCLNLSVPLPPLPEQRRIAAILDQADALRAKRREALAQLDTLTQSIFIEMFGDPDENVRGLPVEMLGTLCKRITDGTHQSPKWETTGVPFLFISNIVDGQITFETHKFISDETYVELTRRCPIELGDVLYTTVGSYGNAAVVKTTERFAFQRHIAHIKPDMGKAIPSFVAAMIQSTGVRRQVDKVAKGVAQKTVNLADLKSLLVFAPPLPLQQTFATRIQSVEALKATHRVALQELDRLFASLQHCAFSGEL